MGEMRSEGHASQMNQSGTAKKVHRIRMATVTMVSLTDYGALD